ncbi:hsp70 protein [Sarocladium implicatum]|nr:hsp70 protein [Sarocladium implicatum]
MAPFRVQKANKILVGIDYGVTFSGVSFTHSGDPDSIETVTNWETRFSHCSTVEKTPTKLSYDKDHNIIGWGYDIPPNADAISWFKLLLLKDEDVPSDVAASEHFKQARAAQKKLGKTSVELASDYLRKLWEHALASIQTAVGEDLMECCDFRVTITVPAIWPPYAHERVLQAAKAAGIASTALRMVTVGLVSEPEAAALATLKDMAKRCNIKVGDIIIVCDCGGGTVDLISYRVESLHPFSVKECVKGGGGLCGGIFLDEKFLKAVQAKLGKRCSMKSDELRKSTFFNDAWEHGIKTQFKDQHQTWLVDVPAGALSSRGKRLRTVEMSGRSIFNVFDPIVRKIENLVEEQATAIRNMHETDAKYIVLVGGFGRNCYLFQRLRDGAQGSTSVLQSQGSKPWTAISRGAVIHGILTEKIPCSLSVKVEGRIARMSCGVVHSSYWNSAEHDPEDKYWCPVEWDYMAANQMSWFLKIGDSMDELKPIRKSFTRLLKDSCCPITDKIFVSWATAPPNRRDAMVSRLCEIKWHTRDLKRPIPKWTNPVDKVFSRLEFEVEMTAHGGTVEFAVYCGSQKLGSQDVEVDFL